MDTITVVEKQEYDELTELWERSVRATHHFLKEEDIQYFKPLILNNYLDAVELSCIRNTERKILAFMGVHGHKIEMLFVDPVYRGRGLGKTLVSYAIDELRITKVDVNEANVQALGFYKKMGFIQTGYSESDGSGKPFPLILMSIPGIR